MVTLKPTESVSVPVADARDGDSHPRTDTEPMPGPESVREAWATFLERWVWDWFVTLTFREQVHPERADKLFRVWISKINRALYGPRWFKHGDGVYWARALEYQKRAVLHYHALLGDERLSELRRLTWMDTWSGNRAQGGLEGGWARIEPPMRPDAVRTYVSKYVAKGGEIDLGGPLMREPLPPFSIPLVVLLPPLDRRAKTLQHHDQDPTRRPKTAQGPLSARLRGWRSDAVEQQGPENLGEAVVDAGNEPPPAS